MYSVKKNTKGVTYTRAESWLEVVTLPFELRPSPVFYKTLHLVIPAVTLKWFAIWRLSTYVTATSRSEKALSGTYEGENILVEVTWSETTYLTNISIRSAATNSGVRAGAAQSPRTLRAWNDLATNEEIVEILWGQSGVLEWWDYFLGRNVDIPDRLY